MNDSCWEKLQNNSMEKTILSMLCQHLSRLYFSPLLLPGLFRGLWNSDHVNFNQGIFFFLGLPDFPDQWCVGRNLGLDDSSYHLLPGVSVVKNSPANAGGIGDVGSIPGLEGSSEEEMATHSSVPACEIPWTEEPGGLQSIGLQSLTWLSMHAQHGTI